jgi:hypothetical protein
MALIASNVDKEYRTFVIRMYLLKLGLDGEHIKPSRGALPASCHVVHHINL